MMLYFFQTLVLLFFIKKIGRKIEFPTIMQLVDFVLFICSFLMILLIDDNITKSQVAMSEAN
jgi:hypothetical protein